MAADDITPTARDIERLVEWMRRSGRPQTINSLVRRYLEMVREERGIRDNGK